MKFVSFLCTKWMENCEAMTSSTHSFAYSYGLVKKCFLKICETSKFHNFLIFQPIFIRFSLFCSENFTLSSEIKLDQLRTSPLIESIGILLATMPKKPKWHPFSPDIHPSKKVTQHDFDRLYLFYPGFAFSKLDISGKPCLFSLRLMPYLFGLFHWGVCRMSIKLGAMAKKSCKIDRILWEMCIVCYVLFRAFLLWVYAVVPTAPGPIHCIEILRNKTSCWNTNSDAILEH